MSYRQLLLRGLQEDPRSRIDDLFSNVHFPHMPAKCERLAIGVDVDFSPSFGVGRVSMQPGGPGEIPWSVAQMPQSTPNPEGLRSSKIPKPWNPSPTFLDRKPGGTAPCGQAHGWWRR
ncbi:hypothetical protein ACWCWD_21465 [Streptomyces sp. NPDC001493]